MKQVLYDYEIFPMIFPAGRDVRLTIRPLGAHGAFDPSAVYHVSVHRIDAGSPGQAFSAWNRTDFDLHPEADGALRFSYTAEAECEHFVRLYRDDRRLAQFSVYALADDLADRIPLRGDLHTHTCRSDGHEAPATVCANYRKQGYDFIVVTDHERYYPSLEAMDAFRDTKPALCILPGEEVHLPGTDVHIINAGGLYSVNGRLTNRANYRDTDGADDKRARGIMPPPILTEEAYEAEIAAVEQALPPLPENVNRHWFAVCVWGFDQIRQGDGLAVFVHPFWISDMWQIPEAFTRCMMERHPFDAFEVLGGENYYEQNGFQTALYYDEYKNGREHPIVGSTDSHGSTEHNRNAAICSTIVFAEKNERASILQAIREKKSVAVDTISAEYRLVGPYRLQKYAAFLMENYFPVHDRQAAMDGEMLCQYVAGYAEAEEVNRVSARADVLRDHLLWRK